MQSEISAQLALGRHSSLRTQNRPATSNHTHTQSYTPQPTRAPSFSSHSRPIRSSYHPPPTYHPQDWQWLQQVETAGPVFAAEDGQTSPPQIYQRPLPPQHVQRAGSYHAQTTLAVSTGQTGTIRRTPSIADAVRSGVRSLGRRLSYSAKGKAIDSAHPDNTHHADHSVLKEKMNRIDTGRIDKDTRSKTWTFRSGSTKRPSMPILKFTPHKNEMDVEYDSQQEQENISPNVSDGEAVPNTARRPLLPAGGAGARASAAAQNEAFQLMRSTPLPPYRPRSPEPAYQEIRDDESGIGMAISDLTRSRSVTPRLTQIDPTDILAPELVENILSFLDIASVTALESVSSTWQRAARSRSLWQTLFYRDFAPGRSTRELAQTCVPGLGKNTLGQDYRNLYRVRVQISGQWDTGRTAAYYLNGHKDSVYCIQFDEHKIITGSRDATVRVWDTHTYQCIKKIAPPNNHREHNDLITDEPDPSGLIPEAKYECSSLEPRAIRSHLFHTASILCLQYDDELLVTGSSDYTCIVWLISQDQYTPLFRLVGHDAGVLDVCLTPTQIITCSKDTTIKIWNRHDGTLISTLKGHRGPVNAIQIRGDLLASASGDGMARLWRLDGLKSRHPCIKEFSSRERGLACVELNHDGSVLWTGGNDHLIYEFDTRSGRLLRELRGHSDLVRSLHFDADGGRLVSGSYDLGVFVWDVSDDTVRATSRAPRSQALRTNPCDPEHATDLLTPGQENRLQRRSRHDVSQPKVIAPVHRLEQWTSSWMLAAKSDYRKIACASQDGRVVVVDFGIGIQGVEAVEA